MFAITGALTVIVFWTRMFWTFLVCCAFGVLLWSGPLGEAYFATARFALGQAAL
jgi:hypothetical protein